MQIDPQTYFMEEHYRGYPVVLLRLSRIGADALTRLIEDAWRMLAPKRLLATWEKSHGHQA